MKKRLFEAYVRARQLGGDEAGVALVCCAGDSEDLRDEMRRDMDAQQRIHVFGREYLADLSATLGEWIRDESRET